MKITKDVLMELLSLEPAKPFKYEGEPVVIYGAGQLGRSSSDYLKKAGVIVENFIDKNPNLEGQLVNGIPCIYPEQLSPSQLAESIFAIGVTKIAYNSIKKYLLALGARKFCYIGDLVETTYGKPSIANAWYFSILTQLEKKELTDIFSSFTDEDSRRAFYQIISWLLLRREVAHMEVCDSEEKYFIKEIREVLKNNEIFIDCGAFDGNSVTKIKKMTNEAYSEIHSFEPDPENFKLLNCNTHSEKNVKLYNFGLGASNEERNFTVGLGLTSRFTDLEVGEKRPIKKIDDVMHSKPYSFLKVYGLGIGREVLRGALETIKLYRPIIAVNIYHTKEDFMEIPKLLQKNLENYDVLLRLHGYCGVDAVIYAIPKERYERSR